MLSRSQFELACKAFSQCHPCWSWCDNPRTGYGYLTRTTTHTCAAIPDLKGEVFIVDSHGLDIDDLATAQPSSPSIVGVKEYIVYAASFNVPTFYFTMHDSTGLPLSLADVVQTSLFKVKPPDGSETTTFALTFPSAPFPLLSQDVAVGEFMSEVEEPYWAEETRFVRWLELWLMILGSVVNL